MAGLKMGSGSMLLILALLLVVLPGKAAAFGAGNIPSIAQVEGHNWRHGGMYYLVSVVSIATVVGARGLAPSLCRYKPKIYSY